MAKKYTKLIHEKPNPEKVKACQEYMADITEKVIKPWLSSNGYISNKKS